METFLDLVREVANRLQCDPDYDGLDSTEPHTNDLSIHRYEAFSVLWTVVNDPELIDQLRKSSVAIRNANLRDLF